MTSAATTAMMERSRSISLLPPLLLTEGDNENKDENGDGDGDGDGDEMIHGRHRHSPRPPIAIALIPSSPPLPSGASSSPTTPPRHRRRRIIGVNKRGVRCRPRPLRIQMDGGDGFCGGGSCAFGLVASKVSASLKMRSRSSRLFVVLLHLVGISTRLPPSRSNTSGGSGEDGYGGSSFFARWALPSAGVGIVGVHPTPIKLERLALETTRRGLAGIIERLLDEETFVTTTTTTMGRGASIWTEETVLGEPYWFQDTDGTCLGPGGFSECGDTTLWMVRRRRTKRLSDERQHKQRRRERERRDHQRRQRQQQRENQHQPNNGRSRSQRVQKQQSAATSSTVCVWPLFCDRGSRIAPPPKDGDDDYKWIEDQEEGFALQLVDTGAFFASGDVAGAVQDRPKADGGVGGLFWSRLFRRERTGDESDSPLDPSAECLLSTPFASYPPRREGRSTTTRAHGPADRPTSTPTSLRLGPCSSDYAWTWHVGADGSLVRAPTKKERRKRHRSGGGGMGGDDRGLFCVNRTNVTSVGLSSCRRGDAVRFSLVRYPTATSSNLLGVTSDASDESSWKPWTVLEGSSTRYASPKKTANESGPSSSALKASASRDKDGSRASAAVGSSDAHLPTSRTSSQNHASAGMGTRQRQVDVKSTESMLHATVGKKPSSSTRTSTSASHVRNAIHHGTKLNPLPPTGGGGGGGHVHRKSGAGVVGVPSSSKESHPGEKGKTPKLSILHQPSRSSSGAQHRMGVSEKGGGGGAGVGVGSSTAIESNNPHKPRKIPKHPYIEASRDGVWIDPQTSLEYLTDLCDYLGHTKKEAGRHTLMGVGQYLRTVFNIKIYGVALYVAKRDVLADPKFAKYAILTSEELSSRDDFYEHLMNRPSPGEDLDSATGGFFDRTLLLKLNMQLSTEAMRQSLEADWSLMTEEHKKLIVHTSLRERKAEERMLEKIKSKENSSNCSCGQSGPDEYKADMTCCARGTELGFTWRKNGDFEIRIDGRIMDTFSRPGMAEGIFSEYLNNDPISRDAKTHFADGFPFLLAPLAQVKGMSSAVPKTQEPSAIKKRSNDGPLFGLFNVAMHSTESVTSQVFVFTKWVQENAVVVSSNVEDVFTDSFNGALGVAHDVNVELDRRRADFIDSAFTFRENTMMMISSQISSAIPFMAGQEVMQLALPGRIEQEHFRKMSRNTSFSRDAKVDKYGYQIITSEMMSDEIGIKIDPTMNFTHRLFFTTVHFYLMLLLVVSLPGTYTTRMVVKRRFSNGLKKFADEL